MRSNVVEKSKPQTIEFLSSSRDPSGIADVSKNLNVSWSTGRQILMELLIEGRVECQKTSNGKLFKIITDESGKPVPERQWCGNSTPLCKVLEDQNKERR